MKVRVLGCSGGIGQGLRTTSMLLDDDILLDCGSGVGDLTADELLAIRHVFVTHAHLDHVCMLPMLVDTVFESACETPITLHASRDVLQALNDHLFNWQLWPDFFVLPSAHRPALLSQAIEVGEVANLDGRRITPLPVNHTVPAQGYLLTAPSGANFAFSGDTGPGSEFWQELQRLTKLDYLCIECAYAEQDRDVARLARHYTPALLARDLAQVPAVKSIYITHLKPGSEAAIMQELRSYLPDISVTALQTGQLISL